MSEQLRRFHAAQEASNSGFAAALAEIETTGKRGHWIWYVFPQLVGLGVSDESKRYGIHGADEAVEYLQDPVTGGTTVCSTRECTSVAPATPGTLEHFLAERYFLYTLTRAGSLLRGQVHHTPYPLQRAVTTELDENLLAAAGITRPTEAPLVHYASAVNVDVFALRKV